MPELCRFYGIIITMYRELGGRHHSAHPCAARWVQGRVPSRRAAAQGKPARAGRDRVAPAGADGQLAASQRQLWFAERTSALQDWTIAAFRHLGPRCLELRFADGVVREIDFTAVAGGWLAKLADERDFAQVSLNDTDTGNLQWPDGENFNPEALHDWSDFEAFYVQDARRTQARAGVATR